MGRVREVDCIDVTLYWDRHSRNLSSSLVGRVASILASSVLSLSSIMRTYAECLAEIKCGFHLDWIKWSLDHWKSLRPETRSDALVPDSILDPNSSCNWVNAGLRFTEVFLMQLEDRGLNIPCWPARFPGMAIAMLTKEWVEGESFQSPCSEFVYPRGAEEYFVASRQVRVVHRWYRLSTCGIARQLKLIHHSCFSLVGVRPACPGILAARGWFRLDAPSMTAGLFVRRFQPDVVSAIVLSTYCPLTPSNIYAFHDRLSDSFCPWKFDGWLWYSDLYEEDRIGYFDGRAASVNLWSTVFE